MNKKVIIGIVALSVVVITAGTFVAVKMSSSSKSKNTLNKYVELLNDKDYEGMYAMISKESQDSISQDDFIARNKNIYEGIEANTIEVDIDKVSKTDNGQTLDYNFKMNTLAGEINFDNSLDIKKDGSDKENKIVWNSKLIFPNLENEDKVGVDKVSGKRGEILDRNGKQLAKNGNVANIGIVPHKLAEPKEESIAKLATILDMDVEVINSKLNASYVTSNTFVPLTVVSYDDEKVNKSLEVPGIMVVDKASRIYPLGEGAAHLTGYVQNINAEELEKNKDAGYNDNSIIGKAGLESIYESKLRGIDGYSVVIKDKFSKVKETVATKEVVNGTNLKLTIDIDMQQLLYGELANDAGASVAMNPTTGEVLALVSTPTYNPNDFVLGMSTTKWNQLNEDPKKPLYNRFQSNVSPGSVFKPITAAIGIDNKSIDINEDKKITGLKWQKDESWGGYYVTRVKEYSDPANLKNALVYSDNIYFAQAALKMGASEFTEKLKTLGFGESVPLEYGVSKSQLSASGEIKGDILLADSGYGQGEVLLNPVHLASIYTAFMNEGNMLKPYLEYKDSKESEVWKENVFSKEASKIVLDDMIAVVSTPDGSGNAASTPGLSIAGKTGTAEIKLTQDDATGTELGWFAAMTTDRKDDNLLVISMVEDVKGRGGSSYVIPKVKKAFETLK